MHSRRRPLVPDRKEVRKICSCRKDAAFDVKGRRGIAPESPGGSEKWLSSNSESGVESVSASEGTKRNETTLAEEKFIYFMLYDWPNTERQ
jgi:hypothetical protein